MLTLSLICIALELVSHPGPPESSKALIARLEAAYRPAKTLHATFLEQYSEGGRVVRTEAGIAYFRRPGKMRWEYEAPEKNLFLVDGKTAWFYVPEDHTVTKVPAKQSTDWRTPFALLAGEMKVSRVCSRVEIAADEKPLNPENVVLHCVLRGSERKEPAHSQGGEGGAAHSATAGKAAATEPTTSADEPADQTAFFEIAPETGELARILVRQSGGVQIDFQFKNWRFNPPIADSLFHFTPPPGVAIVNGEPPPGEATVN